MSAPRQRPKERQSPFDRVRPRTEQPSPVVGRGESVDTQGKRALFSTAPAVPALGSVSVQCSACRAQSVLSLRQAVRAAFPSLHLPLIRGRYSSWMRCPACGRRTWVRARLHL